ncbi:MAG: hypothetical protein M5U28_30400 [Sandaracinaceae bacterium]|nr:hypothetical protein [Sandaracinaceae bacterium]
MRGWIALVLVSTMMACAGPPLPVARNTSKQARTDPHRACASPTDCVVVPRSCCGTCGVASRGDAVALHRELAASARSARCAGTGCPDCTADPDPTLLATCRARRCELVDLLRSPLTRCRTADDCQVRTSACCVCDGTAPYVALASDQDDEYAALVCAPDARCGSCLMTRPSAPIACLRGHCRVTERPAHGRLGDL